MRNTHVVYMCPFEVRLCCLLIRQELHRLPLVRALDPPVNRRILCNNFLNYLGTKPRTIRLLAIIPGSKRLNLLPVSTLGTSPVPAPYQSLYIFSSETPPAASPSPSCEDALCKTAGEPNQNFFGRNVSLSDGESFRRAH